MLDVSGTADCLSVRNEGGRNVVHQGVISLTHQSRILVDLPCLVPWGTSYYMFSPAIDHRRASLPGFFAFRALTRRSKLHVRHRSHRVGLSEQTLCLGRCMMLSQPQATAILWPSVGNGYVQPAAYAAAILPSLRFPSLPRKISSSSLPSFHIFHLQASGDDCDFHCTLESRRPGNGDSTAYYGTSSPAVSGMSRLAAFRSLWPFGSVGTLYEPALPCFNLFHIGPRTLWPDKIKVRDIGCAQLMFLAAASSILPAATF